MYIKHGLTMDNQALIINKAKSKSDGCYQFRGVAYRVEGGEVTHYATNGQVLESAFGFNVIIGDCPARSNEALKFIKKHIR